MPRKPTQLRPIKFKINAIKTADGSCEISFGDTRVICTAMWQKGVPAWKEGEGSGWVTAEYAMLPGSSPKRVSRKKSSRASEIQRLIGRSLRAVTDLGGLGENTVLIDCDVIQADGGTRSASITGGFVAMVLAMEKARKKKIIPKIPVIDYIAAVSVGIVNGKLCLDLDYEWDVRADVDMNVVMTGSGKLVEIQGTAEGQAFSRRELNDLVTLSAKGIHQIMSGQKKLVAKYLF
jgi:ribonuclease PH